MSKLRTNIVKAWYTPYKPVTTGGVTTTPPGDYIDYQELGRVLTNYILSVVSYKAPNVNTGLKSK